MNHTPKFNSMLLCHCTFDFYIPATTLYEEAGDAHEDVFEDVWEEDVHEDEEEAEVHEDVWEVHEDV